MSQATPTISLPPPGCPAHQALAPLYGEEFASRPEHVYEQLRQRYGPVAPVHLDGGIPAWLVLGYHEYRQVLCDPRRFAADPHHWPLFADGQIPADWPLMPLLDPGMPTPHHNDGLAHDRLRGTVTYSLDRLDPRTTRRRIEHAADELIDAFAGDGHADLIPQYAGLLPAAVVARLLGLPRQDANALIGRVRTILDEGSEAPQAQAQISAVLQDLVADRAATPAPDLTSYMLQSPHQMEHGEIIGLVWMLLLAGLEMCQSVIAYTTVRVLTSALRSELNGGRTTIPDAITHTLWHTPPVNAHLGRVAREDVRLGNVLVRRGDMVILGTSAASADPAIDRQQAAASGNRAYPAFGAGPHVCPATDLAIAIISTATDQLLHRLPDLRLDVPADQLPRRASLTIQGLSSLPVRFRPATAAPSPART